MPQRHAIIFDMDGLMVDSEPLARKAWDQALRTYGHNMTDEVYSQIIGRRTDQSAQIIIDHYHLPLTNRALADQKTAFFHEIRAQGIPAMPGLMALQAEIKHRHIPWAVATSSPRSHAEIILAQLGLRDDCFAIAAGDEVEQGKPAPDIYLLAAKRLDIDPDFCLALEDSVPGCMAAAAAGMKVIAIPNGATRTAVFPCAYTNFNTLNQVADHLDKLLSS